MSNTEDEGIETSRGRDWVVSLEMDRLLGTNIWDRNGEATIYRVPDFLKRVDPQAYEPLLVSLGPYHRNKPHLQAMNQLKWKCLNYVVALNRSMVLKDYVELIKNLETRARNAYSEEVEMSSNSFVKMMLLDGCFVMLTIIRMNYVLQSSLCTHTIVVRDMFMLENQLPLFLLETLYESAFPDDRGRNLFRYITLEFIRLHFSSNLKAPADNETFHHIIHLFLSCIDPTTNHGNGNGNGNGNGDQSSTFGFLCISKLFKKVFVSLPSKLCSYLLSHVNKICQDAIPEEDLDGNDLSWIPSATRCNDGGILFKRKQKSKSFLDITFHNGKLEIPQLRIDDYTNVLLRNFIAYEQCSTGSKFRVTCYHVFMDYLIDTAADVELLQQHKIIISDLGESQEIATLFNKLGTNVTYALDDFYLENVLTAMRKHHDTRCNKWRARLNRDYFSNPWAVISLIGALILFLLTALQSTFAVLSYFRPPK